MSSTLSSSATRSRLTSDRESKISLSQPPRDFELNIFIIFSSTDEVFSAANCLISQTNLILKTLKIEFDNVPV